MINYLIPYNYHKKLTFFETGLFEEDAKRKEIEKFLKIYCEQLFRMETYLLLHNSDEEKLQTLAKTRPFLDPAKQSCVVNRSLIETNFPALDFNYVIYATLKPGTSDAVGNVALDIALQSVGEKKQSGDQGFQAVSYYLQGHFSNEELKRISNFLFNPELYTVQFFNREELIAGIDIRLPLVALESDNNRVEEFKIAEFSDEELLALNKKHKLAASLAELKHFREVYQRQDFIEKRKEFGLSGAATDVELETWFGLRSEHCFHKEFNARIILKNTEQDPVFQKAIERGWLREKNGSLILEDGMFKTFIRRPAEKVYQELAQRGKNWIASMFSDNSGVVYYDEDYMYCLKVETHNSPSNIEPVQGAKTGLNGNFRDIMGTMQGSFDILMGFFCYCTGRSDYEGWLPKGVKHPYMLLKGMTRGVREAGNEMQIPTLGGLVFADPRYIAKCLVYCGAVGWSPVKNKTGRDLRTKTPAIADRVLLAGQAVGIDGIHGATESSLSASSEISLGHVQADFSFIQVRVKEFLLEASRQGLFTAVTDFGAMGLGSASHETARSTGGLEIDLAKHPVKYQGILPWQINCSETQDRMLLVVNPEKLNQVFELARFYDVELSDLGELTNSGFVHLKYREQTVGLIDISVLFESEPRKEMYGSWKKRKLSTEISEIKFDLNQQIIHLMSHPDVASKEWFFRQKDFSVKGSTILGPLYGKNVNVDSDATLQKPLDTEGRDNGAIAYALAAAPKYSDIDPYLAVQKSYFDVLGKVIALGGKLPNMKKACWDAWAVCGNYCQPNSERNTTLSKDRGEENLAALVREGIAIRELVEEFNIPIISGKDSMKCSCIYEVEDSFSLEDVPAELRKHIYLEEIDGSKKIELHNPATYLVSAAVKIADYTKCQNAEFKFAGDLIYLLGENYSGLGRSAWAETLKIEIYDLELPSIEQFKAVVAAMESLFEKEILASSAYISAGGLAACLLKALFASGLGAEVRFSDDLTNQLFSESPGRFLLTIDPKDQVEFENSVGNFHLIGKVVESGLLINSMDINLEQAEQSYRFTYDFGGLS